MNYRFKNLLGAPYRGGNILLREDTKLFSPVGNRVNVVDLTASESNTLPFQTMSDVSLIALSPDGNLLIAVDADGRSRMVNVHRRVVLHLFRFKFPVGALKFSPDGKFFAAGVGRQLQIWHTPEMRKTFSPMRLYKSFSGGYDKVTAIDWSPDGKWIVAANKDLTARIYSLDSFKMYKPVRLTGHKDVLVAVFFYGGGSAVMTGAGPKFKRADVALGLSGGSGGIGEGPGGAEKALRIYTVAKDGALFCWFFDPFHKGKRRGKGNGWRADRGERVYKRGKGGGGEVVDDGGEDGEEEDGKEGEERGEEESEGEEEEDEREVAEEEEGEERAEGKAEGEEGEQGEEEKEEEEEEEGEDEEEGDSDEEGEEGEREEGKEGSTAADGEEEEEEEEEQPRKRTKTGRPPPPVHTRREFRLDEGKWRLESKHFFMQAKARLTSCDLHKPSNLLVAGFSNGIFGLYQLPLFTTLHLMSISRTKISSVTFNESGDWIAVGCARLGQLLVWEWRSEAYVMKVQGHFYDVSCVAFSPDGTRVVTGSDDAKVKVWSLASGFCFVTLAEHTGPVTAVAFLPSGAGSAAAAAAGGAGGGGGGGAVLSASLDGTVRAFDLLRYRCFRTLTTPQPVQFASLAVHPSGEVVCAASQDDFQVYVWSMRTGRLLDVLAGHEGPVHSLTFSPSQELLASGAWDSTCRLWDVFAAKSSGTEALPHSHEVLALAFRPDGRQLATATLDGQIHLWDPQEGELQGSIEGRRDLVGGVNARSKGGRGMLRLGDKSFRSLCYSADGCFLLAAGTSRYVCLYDVAEMLLLRRYLITSNKSLSGAMDSLNPHRLTDAGPLDALDVSDSDLDDNDLDDSHRQRRPSMLGADLPGAARNGSMRRPEIRVKAVQFSPTGQSWAAATTEGLVVFGLDEGVVFDPSDLDMDVTPAAVAAATAAGRHARAIQLALRLNETELLQEAMMAVPPERLGATVSALPRKRLAKVVAAVGALLEGRPQLEYVLLWCKEIVLQHGKALALPPGTPGRAALRPPLQALSRALTQMHDDLALSASSNQHLLQYLDSLPAVAPAATSAETAT